MVLPSAVLPMEGAELTRSPAVAVQSFLPWRSKQNIWPPSLPSRRWVPSEFAEAWMVFSVSTFQVSLPVFVSMQ